jgi:hypothetical protein
MTGREKDNDLGYHDQDSEPSLNAPGDAGPTGTADGAEDTDDDMG